MASVTLDRRRWTGWRSSRARRRLSVDDVAALARLPRSSDSALVPWFVVVAFADLAVALSLRPAAAWDSRMLARLHAGLAAHWMRPALGASFRIVAWGHMLAWVPTTCFVCAGLALVFLVAHFVEPRFTAPEAGLASLALVLGGLAAVPLFLAAVVGLAALLIMVIVVVVVFALITVACLLFIWGLLLAWLNQ